MVVALGSLATSFALAVLLTICWRLVNWVWLRPKKLEKLLREQGLNGNPYKFLFGDSKEIRKMLAEALNKPISSSNNIIPRVIPFFHYTVKKYGKKSFSWTGTIPRVNILEPELINELFLKTNIYKKPKMHPILNFVICGLATLNDEKWAMHRKIMTPVFFVEKLKLMYPAMQLSCKEMVKKWEALLSDTGSCEFDVLPYLHNFTSDVIARTSFGSSYEEGKKIFEHQKELAVAVGFLPTQENRRLKKIHSEVRSLLTDIIKQKEKNMKLGQSKEDDLLGTLLKSNQQEIEEHSKSNKKGYKGMSLDDVIDECKLFYFAGQDTTANLLVWTMIMLSIHREWQEKAREEVLQVFGKDVPDYNGLGKLQIVTMILNETLRLYPPVTTISKVLQNDTQVGDTKIPAKTLLTMQLLMVHHDPQLWGEDASEFNPERFSQGVLKAPKKKEDVLCFYPFGRGPRACVGNNFALMEAKMAVVMILQRFAFELSPSYTHAPFMEPSLQPQHGAHLIVTKI